MKSWDIIGYTYAADIYCSGCIVDLVLDDYPEVKSYALDYVSTEGDLKRIASFIGVNYSDHYSYDTDNFPKAILASDEDCLEDHCGKCHERLVD